MNTQPQAVFTVATMRIDGKKVAIVQAPADVTAENVETYFHYCSAHLHYLQALMVILRKEEDGQKSILFSEVATSDLASVAFGELAFSHPQLSYDLGADDHLPRWPQDSRSA